MQSFIHQITVIIDAFKTNMPLVLGMIAFLWLFNAVVWLTKRRLFIFGIYPHTWHGFIGIPISPLLHGNVTHLLLNSVLFFVMANFVLLGGHLFFVYVTLFIAGVGGLAVWIFGRKSLHIGLSGVNMGYWGLLLIRAWRDPTIMTIAVAFVCLYYFGGLFLDLFPREEKVSWEGHLFGFLAGVAYAFLF